MKITEVDEIIFRIIGTESNILDGLNIPESSGTSSVIVSSSQEEVSKEPSLVQSLINPKQTAISRSLPKKRKLDDGNINKNRKLELQENLLDLQCQIATKELRLKELEILKIERELGILYQTTTTTTQENICDVSSKDENELIEEDEFVEYLKKGSSVDE